MSSQARSTSDCSAVGYSGLNSTWLLRLRSKPGGISGRSGDCCLAFGVSLSSAQLVEAVGSAMPGAEPAEMAWFAGIRPALSKVCRHFSAGDHCPAAVCVLWLRSAPMQAELLTDVDRLEGR